MFEYLALQIRQNRKLQEVVIHLSRYQTFKYIFIKIYLISSSLIAKNLVSIKNVKDCLLHGSLVGGDPRPGVSDIDFALIIDDEVYQDSARLQSLIDSALKIVNKSIIPTDVRVYTERQFKYVGTYGRLSYLRRYYSYKKKCEEPIYPLDPKYYEISKVLSTLKNITNLYYYFKQADQIAGNQRLFIKFKGHITRLVSIINEYSSLKINLKVDTVNKYSLNNALNYIDAVWGHFPQIILAADSWICNVIPDDSIEPIADALKENYLESMHSVALNVIYNSLPQIQFISSNDNNIEVNSPAGTIFYLTQGLLPRFLLLRPRGVALIADRYKEHETTKYLVTMLLSDFIRRPQTIFMPDHVDAIKDSALYYAVAKAIISHQALNCLDRNTKFYQPTWDEHVKMWNQAVPDFIDA